VAVTSIKELKQAKGITPKIFEKLKPFITALPSQTRININTAPPEVLKSLSPDFNDQIVEQIIQTRKETPYTDVTAFIKQIKQQIKPRVLYPANLSEIITVKSEFFLCHSSVTMKEAKLELRSLIFRNKQSMQIVSRQSGKE
jgi:general secretion pathway protein K